MSEKCESPFFVTALPRSRTAWVANWLTTDGSLCYHDVPFSENKLREDRLVGFSGPELVLQYEWIHQNHPESPWLVIERDSDACLASFREWAGDKWPDVAEDALIEFWTGRRQLLRQIADQIRSKRVHWNALDDEQTARDIYAWLMPKLGFDVERWALLVDMNVQQRRK